MPLLDHFRPPLYPRHHWESFHSNWATRIADSLNDRWLPAEFFAEEYTHAGNLLQIDVATYGQHDTDSGPSPDGGPVLTLKPQVWVPPLPKCKLPAVFPDSFEVRVFNTTSGVTLVAAIELISPSNKDRPEERRAFATKCASYLHQGVSLIIMDIVTNRRANMHNAIMDLMEAAEETRLPQEAELYSVAYRPVLRDEHAEIDLWTSAFALGQTLPTMPLRLTGDLFVPVDFEATYQEACRRRRLA